jgi:hypothetical protein
VLDSLENLFRGKQIKVGNTQSCCPRNKLYLKSIAGLTSNSFVLERSQSGLYLQRINAEDMCGLCKNKSDFLSNHYLISRIKSDVSTGNTTIRFMVGGYA